MKPRICHPEEELELLDLQAFKTTWTSALLLREGLGLREEKRMDSWQAGGDSGDEDEELKDFRYGGKDATIFLVDCSPKMHLRSLECTSIQINIKHYYLVL